MSIMCLFFLSTKSHQLSSNCIIKDNLITLEFQVTENMPKIPFAKLTVQKFLLNFEIEVGKNLPEFYEIILKANIFD